MKEKKQSGIGAILILIVVLLVLTVIGTVIFATVARGQEKIDTEQMSKDIAPYTEGMVSPPTTYGHP